MNGGFEREKNMGAKVEQSFVSAVRERLILELEESLKNFGAGWQENTKGLIGDLRSNRETKIGGPIFGDFLTGILEDTGIPQSDPRFREIWRRIESGS